MKSRFALYSMLLIALLAMNANAQDYPVSHGAGETISHSDHYPIYVGISGTESPSQLLNNIATAPRCAAYFDKTTTIFELTAGETVTPSIYINGDWMHGYVYVNWDDNKQFDVNITGTGTHNYDGFDNKYVGYELEYITDGAYSVKNSVNRGKIVKAYFTDLVAEAEISDALREEVNDAVQALGDEPTTEEIDGIYSLLQSEAPGDPFDGKIVTFTNVQQNGSDHTLYISDSKTLEVSSSSAANLGEKAKFECRKQANGKYTFFNKSANVYMIWRAGNPYGYNNNSGTLATYNATYCDWSVFDASSTEPGTYYFVSKRDGGTSDGSLVVMSATGKFDSWGNSAAWASNYSNLYQIDVIDNITAIDDIEVDKDNWDGRIYDLQGRLVKNPTTGIYVINGKKVFIDGDTFRFE